MLIAINILVIAVIAFSTYPGIKKAFIHIKRITLPDTRWISLQWVDKNLPISSRIGREQFTPPIEEYTDKFKAKWLGYFAVARRPEKVKEMDYMIVSSGDYARILQSPDRYPNEAKSYINFFKNNDLVKEFSPDGKKIGGPTIKVYAIKK